MGEFAQLNYIVFGVLFLSFLILLTRIKWWITYRWWTFSLVQGGVTLLLMHPVMLVLVYWQLVMDNQRLFPYPYTAHDRISFYLYLCAIACSFGVLLYMQVLRGMSTFKAVWLKFKSR